MYSNNSRTLKQIMSERRLEGMQTRKRKRETGIAKIDTQKIISEPFPNGTFQRLESIGLWEKILDNLIDKLDICSAFNVCPKFRDLLGKSVMTEIFEILKERKFICLNSSFQHMSVKKFAHDNGRDEPGYLSQKAVLAMRLVSKTWKRIADTIFLDQFTGDWRAKLMETNISSLPTSVAFFEIHEIAKVDAAMRRTPNPSLFVQILHLEIDTCAESFFFFMKLMMFLETYGELIQGLRFCLGGSEFLVARRYLLLMDLVTRMPNLKAIVMDSMSPDRATNEDALEQVIKDSPFPCLNSLELVKLEKYEHPKVVAEILQKNPSLKSLTLPESLDLNAGIVETMKNLKLEYYSSTKDWHSNGLLERVTWPLKKLKLPASSSRFGNPSVFPVVNRFANTLVSLELDCIKDVSGSDRFELPHLKKLSAKEVYTNWYGLDFLLPIIKLEHLEFRRLVVKKEDKPSLSLEFGGLNGKWDLPTIWKCLPRLKRFVIKKLEYNAVLDFMRP